MKRLLTFLSTVIFSASSLAMIQTQAIDYTSKEGDKMEGFLAYDDSGLKTKPAVLIVHDWMGLGEFQKAKAQELAKMGYVAFAVDIYGKGQRPKDQAEAAEFAGKYKAGDRKLLRSHITAAYEAVKGMKNVSSKKIIVMGYCFGGTTALELARSGAELAGTASFHGGLSTENANDAKSIKAPVLVMHGADDPYVKQSEVDAFKKEMNEAKVNLQFVAYKGAVHSFAVPTAGSDKSTGAAYNLEADKKSWAEFTRFLKSTTK